MRKICVITGTRADFGLLKWVIKGIGNDQNLKLNLCVTGTHLASEFGMTYREIEADGFVIDQKLNILSEDDSLIGVTKSIGRAIIGFADIFNEQRSDIIVLLGDRFEILAAATAALIARIPIAHIHGGEITMGAYDDSIRHAVTKMSHLHFVATEQYRQRVIQLGESPERVFLTGGLGADMIAKTNLLDRKTLEVALNFKFNKKNLLITFHPVTLEIDTAEMQMTELLKALDSLIDTNLIFTLPNFDTGSRKLIHMIENFVKTRRHAKAFASLGYLKYLSCLAQVDGVVGNSSSGLAEAPSFKKGTINIGNRQQGRIKAASVIDCEPENNKIQTAIKKLYSSEFKKILESVVNPYGEGGASEKIVNVLKNFNISEITKKTFYDFK